MANSKAHLTPEELAATAGHKTTATAQLHYADRSTGWGPKTRCVPRPTPADLKQILRSPKTDWIITKEKLRKIEPINDAVDSTAVETQTDAAAKSDYLLPNEILDRRVSTPEPFTTSSPISKQPSIPEETKDDFKCGAAEAILPPTKVEVDAIHELSPADEPTDIAISENPNITNMSEDSAEEDELPKFGM